MLSLVYDLYDAAFYVLHLVVSALLIVLFWIIPRLPLTGTEDHVECRA